MTPVFIAMISQFLGFERIHWAAWAGIAVSFTGVLPPPHRADRPPDAEFGHGQGQSAHPRGQPDLGRVHGALEAPPRQDPAAEAGRSDDGLRHAVLSAFRRGRRGRDPLRPHSGPGLGSDPLLRRPGHRRRLRHLLQLGPQGRQHEDGHLQQPQPRLRHDLRRSSSSGRRSRPSRSAAASSSSSACI